MSVVTDQAPRVFRVELEEFSGPFDVLLGLISKGGLELTALALHEVTDEFCTYIREQGVEWDVDEASSFLVVAATLLDLKAARLLPAGEVDDEADLELLEARDLLFARLLQYRAFKEISIRFADILERNVGVLPRTVGLDPEFRSLQPDVALPSSIADWANLARTVLCSVKPAPTVCIEHLHAPTYSVSEQAELIASEVSQRGTSSFQSLVAGARDRGLIVARFLALLDLAGRGLVILDQEAALAELRVRWVDFRPGMNPGSTAKHPAQEVTLE